MLCPGLRKNVSIVELDVNRNPWFEYPLCVVLIEVEKHNMCKVYSECIQKNWCHLLQKKSHAFPTPKDFFKKGKPTTAFIYVVNRCDMLWSRLSASKAPNCVEENHSHGNPLKPRVHSHPDQNAVILSARWCELFCKIVEILRGNQHSESADANPVPSTCWEGAKYAGQTLSKKHEISTNYILYILFQRLQRSCLEIVCNEIELQKGCIRPTESKAQPQV